ncbi:Arginase [hydrothermal vent metagenome]|uniref:Arginase n=1 Tax=hydrothermal vent metagenome TaxID=652676 RepID=A0A3B0X1R0_9ZZZZ
MSKKIIPTFGAASSIGGPSNSCADAPKVLQASAYNSLLKNTQLQWQPLLEVSNENKNSLNRLKKQSHLISQFTQQNLEEKKTFLVLGGDHSIAMGSWAGVMKQLPSDSTFALIWIDAHMDAHTLETSPSGNVHGMPVSVLLGEAEYELQSCFASQRYLEGKDLYLFGVRSYEAEELVLLSKKSVNVFDTQRIEKEGGTQIVLKQLIETISRCYDCFAISLDLDAIDPKDAPGVETREKTGLSAKNLLSAFSELEFSEKFIGLEIAEFDPKKDKQNKTEKLVYEIIHAIFK